MSEPVTPGEAWRAYFEGTALLTTALERRLKDECGLDLADFNLMLVLHESGGRLRLGTLARQLSFAPGRLTYRMSTLERRGWVRREATPGDRRGAEAVLTDEGERTFRHVRPVHARHVQDLFLGALTDDQIAALDSVFTPLRSTLRGECDTALADDDC